MEVTIHHLGDVKFEAVTRGHRVVCDQPPDNGGADTGMTPPEFLLVSLGTCAGFYAAQYLKLHALPAAGLEVRVSALKAKAPARLGSFRIEVTLPASTSATRPAILRAVHACLIHNTLLNAPAIETVVHTAVLDPGADAIASCLRPGKNAVPSPRSHQARGCRRRQCQRQPMPALPESRVPAPALTLQSRRGPAGRDRAGARACSPARRMLSKGSSIISAPRCFTTVG